MFDCHLFACCTADTLVYECFLFRGHVFRRYPDGRIATADGEDLKAAASFLKWHKRHKKGFDHALQGNVLPSIKTCLRDPAKSRNARRCRTNGRI